jgi:anti-anti-sigma factor
MAAALRIEPLFGANNGYRLIGEIDLSNATRLRTLAKEGTDLYLDMSELGFMDSTGLRAVIELAQTLRPENSVVLLRPSEGVRRLFEVTGVERLENLRIESE